MSDFPERIYIEACPNSEKSWCDDPGVFEECDETHPCRANHPHTVEYVRADILAKERARFDALVEELDSVSIGKLLDSFQDMPPGSCSIGWGMGNPDIAKILRDAIDDATKGGVG